MPTQLYDNVDYTLVTKVLLQIDQHKKRIQGVEFPDYDKLPVSEKTKWELQIQKLTSDCGCNIGARIAAIATLLYLVTISSGLLTPAINPTTNYVLAIPVFLITAIIGKLIGFQMKKKQLRIISNKIRTDLLQLELYNEQKK